jgi:hypothetical protein
MSKILLAVWALFIFVFLTSCQDRQAQIEAEKRDALKAMLNQSNSKQLSDEEIRANLRRNNPSKTTSN